MLLEDDHSVKPVEEHHIFDGPRRKISEELGLKVYLCPEHHRTGKASVHGNMYRRRFLQRIAQGKYEETHSRQEWMRLMGKNYDDL